MRPALAVTLGAALATSLAPAAVAAPARPAAPPVEQPRDLPREAAPNGAERNARAALGVAAPSATSAPAYGRVEGYPRQTQLRTYPVDATDASLKLGLVPYYAIAPRLNALQDRSDRVSVEVIGESHRGRDLYLVTVTAPESRAEARRQARYQRLITEDPARAARDRALARHYKTPAFYNANIHGDEWEGTDAVLRVIDDLATSTDAETKRLLERHRLHFVVTMNPDGRVGNTRRNAADFDMNRDWITASQPEVVAVREALIGTQPVVMLDLHGYVNGTLIEPTTPPHGQNYEYDLFIRNAYPHGLAMEQAVLDLGYTEEADGVRPPVIPFRDWPEGWDDWPPIFTPQYAAFHGAIAHTIEFPLRVNRSDYVDLSVDELRRRTAINTDIAEATVVSSIAYLDAQRDELLADHIEVFRRGAAGEPLQPVEPGELDGLIGPEDVYTTTFPRAYVIPTGGGQRSAVAAARLVDHLVDNDVEVGRLTRAARIAGRSYPAGSYVVDMHQAKRGLANVMLEAGGDVTDRVETMYDISGWSHRLLWGADVDVVEDGRLPYAVQPVDGAEPTGSVRGGGDLLLRVRDPQDVRTVNALLDAGADVRWTRAGDAVVDAAGRRLAVELAARYGVDLRATRASGAVAADDVVVAAAAAGDELWALREMGFDVRPVSTAVAEAGFDWSDVDVLLVSSGLSYSELGDAARESLDDYLATGGVVTRGSTGAAFNAEAGLLDVTAEPGRGDANGVVSVTGARGPIVGSDPLPHSFVYSPLWFTDLGAGVVADQRYADDDVLVSGHWRADDEGGGGQADAAGQASVVRGVDDSGAAVVLFGTEPLFRAHPKGLYAQVGRALHWTAVSAAD